MRRAPDESELQRLMEASVAGDAVGHRELLRLLSSRLRAYFKGKLSRIGRSAADAEDLVQETLIAVHLHRNAYDKSLPVAPWVYSIARYKLIDFLRRTKNVLDDVPIEAADELFARDDQVAAESAFDLTTLLALLPLKMRDAIQYVKLDGLSVHEASKKAGTSESAIKVSIHRGLKALSSLVKREGQS